MDKARVLSKKPSKSKRMSKYFDKLLNYRSNYVLFLALPPSDFIALGMYQKFKYSFFINYHVTQLFQVSHGMMILKPLRPVENLLPPAIPHQEGKNRK